MRTLPVVLLKIHVQVILTPIAKTMKNAKLTRENGPSASLTKKAGRCHRAQSTPSVTAESKGAIRCCRLGSAYPTQPISSPIVLIRSATR